MAEHQMSERHACAFVGLSRNTLHHEGQTSALNMELREQIVQTAHALRRWGYRMIHYVLRPQYPASITSACTASTKQKACRSGNARRAKRIGVRVSLMAAIAVSGLQR